jgi:hypothetical protein
MKIKILATVAAAAFLAIAANGQGTSAAGTTGSATRSGSIITSGSATVTPGANTGAPVPSGPGSVIPANPQSPIQNPNGNPVVGAGMGANNQGMATNNLGLGTNKPGLGQNQFGVRSNNGVAPLTPTGTNSNRILLNP